MSAILEELKARLTEAQKLLTETTQVLQAAQQKQAAAQHQFNVWNMAFQLEQREEQLRQAAATEKQPELPLVNQPPVSASVTFSNVATSTVNAQAISPDSPDEHEGPNKTAIVRNLLRQHPTGMTAVDIWKSIGDQFNHRPYLYSVLKRLRDRNEISKRRNKYFLTSILKSEGERGEQVVH